MTPNTRFQLFEENHAQAVGSIRTMMAHEHDDVRTLVNWLISTDANPYGFLPESWASSLNDAVSFSRLCHQIHHALVDDGEINFIVVTKKIKRPSLPPIITITHGEPRITFLARTHGEPNLHMLSAAEANEAQHPRPGWIIEHSVQFLHGVPAFIDAHAEHQLTTLRKCFLNDARRNPERALAHYQADPLFNPAWIDEIAPAVTPASSERLAITDEGRQRLRDDSPIEATP